MSCCVLPASGGADAMSCPRRRDTGADVPAWREETHRAYVCAYCATLFYALKAVVYDFGQSRAGEHARDFLSSGSGRAKTLLGTKQALKEARPKFPAALTSVAQHQRLQTHPPCTTVLTLPIDTAASFGIGCPRAAQPLFLPVPTR